ncbi:MAG: ACT domain-containing protein, partial [Bacillota bacterium]
RDWLNIVKTSMAKSRIRAWFKRQKREESIAKGEELLEKELRKDLGCQLNEVLRVVDEDEAARRFNVGTFTDLFAAVGYAELSVNTVANYLVDEYRKHVPKEEPDNPVAKLVSPETLREQQEKASNGVEVAGVKDLLVRFSRCCNPIPGDEIVGYITRGRGVSVHRRDCPNVKTHLAEGDRLVDVSWGDHHAGSFAVSVELTGLDRSGLLHDIIKVLADSKTNIHHLNGRSKQNHLAVVDLTLEIRDTDHLNFILDRLRRMRDVYSVERMTPRR